MKKTLHKIVSAVVALFAAVPCAVSPAFANSGPMYEEGVTASGAIVRGEKSALAVESEKLTFNISDFPDAEFPQNYRSTVTAEYKFVNTTENTVKTSMAFPLGNLPPYFEHSWSNLSLAPTVTVNGSEVEAQVRYPYGSYESFSESVKNISDEWYSDGFYRPDLPVTEFAVSMDVQDYGYAYAVGEFKCDASKTRLIGDSLNIDKIRNVLRVGYEPAGSEYFYVLGDASVFECVWHAEVLSNGKYKSVDLPLTVNRLGETTLKEFVLSRRNDDSVVGELDFYNGAVRNFNTGSEFASYKKNYYDSEFLTWYTYDVEVAPNGRVTNSVTAPIFPKIDYRYTPAAYAYNYYLSPAAEWQSFGKLEVAVNTEYNLTSQSYSLNFNKVDGGYTAELDSLPSEELSFSLCSEANPSFWVSSHKETDFNFEMVPVVIFIILEVIFFGAVIFAIVYLVKSKRK